MKAVFEDTILTGEVVTQKRHEETVYEKDLTAEESLALSIATRVLQPFRRRFEKMEQKEDWNRDD